MPDIVLKPDRITATVAKLSCRIEERFPGSSLSGLCKKLLEISQKAEDRSIWIARPIRSLRLLTVAFVILLLLVLGVSFTKVQAPDGDLSFVDYIQVLEAGINDIVLIGAAFFFLVTLETRIKRNRALNALHELRCVSHIIDMHQLTKDPDTVVSRIQTTASSPTRMTAPDLSRYLEYCSEMLSLTGKIAAVYVQHFDDAGALDAVNDIESVTTALSRKIWQKIMILHATQRRSTDTHPGSVV